MWNTRLESLVSVGAANTFDFNIAWRLGKLIGSRWKLTCQEQISPKPENLQKVIPSTWFEIVECVWKGISEKVYCSKIFLCLDRFGIFTSLSFGSGTTYFVPSCHFVTRSSLHCCDGLLCIFNSFLRW